MKRQIIFHDTKKLIGIFVIKINGGNLVKDVTLISEETYLNVFKSFLNDFRRNTIDYTRFEEKVIEDAKNYLKIEVGVACTNFHQRKLNFSREIKYLKEEFSKFYSTNYESVNTYGLKRKQ